MKLVLAYFHYLNLSENPVQGILLLAQGCNVWEETIEKIVHLSLLKFVTIRSGCDPSFVLVKFWDYEPPLPCHLSVTVRVTCC